MTVFNQNTAKITEFNEYLLSLHDQLSAVSR